MVFSRYFLGLGSVPVNWPWDEMTGIYDIVIHEGESCSPPRLRPVGWGGSVGSVDPPPARPS